MADEQIKEMISAYAAGCLDVDNFINFKEYLTGDGDLPHYELGELQNVMALLSISMDLEQPPAALKSNVAKKLISLKGEIKAKLKAEKNTIDQEMTGFEKAAITQFKETKDDYPVEQEVKKPLKQEKPEKTSLPLEDREKNKSVDSKTEPQKEKTEKNQYYMEDVELKTKTARRSKLGFLISVISVILIISLAYYTYDNTIKTKEQIDQINLALKETKAEAEEAKNFIDEHKKLLNFFTYKDIAVVNFEKQSKFTGASAKLFISFERTLGLLMITNLPELIQGEMYQLWLVSRGRSYPVISFIPKKTTNYINISELPGIKRSDIDMFRITTEKKPNPDLPGGNVVLIGGFAK